MKALIEFIERYYPNFSKELIPADEFDIALLEEYTGPLPSTYYQFLQMMGTSMGSVDLAQTNFSIEGKIMTYQAKPWLRNGRYIFIASDNGLDGWDYFLDRSHALGTYDCLLVRMLLVPDFPLEAILPIYISLKEFLYCEAFKSFCLAFLPHCKYFSLPDNAIRSIGYYQNIIHTLAEEKGFSHLPYVEHCALYERDDTALFLYQHPLSNTLSFSLGGKDAKEIEHFVYDLEVQTGLRIASDK
jgi:hypothetical protein